MGNHKNCRKWVGKGLPSPAQAVSSVLSAPGVTSTPYPPWREFLKPDILLHGAWYGLVSVEAGGNPVLPWQTEPAAPGIPLITLGARCMERPWEHPAREGSH